MTKVHPENYVIGATALFGLGKISINMLVERATGKILGQAITGEGAAEFMKYEARVTSGKVVFSDTGGNVIRLEKGTNTWGFDHIFKLGRNTAGKTRIMDLMDRSEVKNFMQKTFGKPAIESFDDFEKLVGYATKNGVFKVTTNGKAEYIIEGIYRIVIDKASGRILTISF